MVSLVVVVTGGVGVICRVCRGVIVSGEGFFLRACGVWSRPGLALDKGFSPFWWLCLLVLCVRFLNILYFGYGACSTPYISDFIG